MNNYGQTQNGASDQSTHSSFTDALHAIRPWLAKKVFHTDSSPMQEQMFRRYIREKSVPAIKGLLIGGIIIILAAWPTDFLVFENRPEKFYSIAILRASFIVIFSAMVFGIEMSETVRHYFNIIFSFGLTILALVIGYCFGRLGGPDLPWYYLSYIFPWLTVIVGFNIITRFLATFTISTAFHIGYFVPFPSHLEYPLLGPAIIDAYTCVILSTGVGHIIYHLNRKNYFNERELEQKSQKLENLAKYDQLTGLYNRRHFQNQFRSEFERALRYDTDLSIVMIDLDHFKDINDTYGHPAGDQVLEQIGRLIQENSRSVDFAGRYGGEEFAIILPETSLTGAKETASRIKSQLSDLKFDFSNEPIYVTCSVGIAEITNDISDAETLLKNADTALYKAKETGRNRIVTF